MNPTAAPHPMPLGPLLDATVHTLDTDNYDGTSTTALIQTWLHELSHYDGLEPVRLALGNLQEALLAGTTDATHMRVLLTELAEYLRFFAQKPEAATPDPSVPEKLRLLGQTLQRLLDSTASIGHS
jgi:hypothetical protein